MAQESGLELWINHQQLAWNQSNCREWVVTLIRATKIPKSRIMHYENENWIQLSVGDFLFPFCYHKSLWHFNYICFYTLYEKHHTLVSFKKCMLSLHTCSIAVGSKIYLLPSKRLCKRTPSINADPNSLLTMEHRTGKFQCITLIGFQLEVV